MTQSRVKWKWILALWIAAASVYILTTESAVALIQTVVGVPREQIAFGEVDVQIPSSWFLLSMRQQPTSDVLIYGLIPEKWIRQITRKKQFPPERFYAFRTGDKGGEMLLFDLDSVHVSKLQEYLKRTPVSESGNDRPCVLTVIELQKHKGLRLACKDTGENKVETVYFPDALLGVVMQSGQQDLLMELRLERRSSTK